MLHTNIANLFDKEVHPMETLPQSIVLSRKQLVASASVILILVGIIAIVSATRLVGELAYILSPTLATIIIFLIFSMVLKCKVGNNLFGELGFLYLFLAVAYTLFPAFTLMIFDSDLVSWQKLAALLPVSSELGIHLWRHALFVFGVATGYLLVRGHETLRPSTFKDRGRKDGPTIALLIGIIVICVLCLSLMSAPVGTYIDNYTRYDHLSWFPRKFVSVCLRLKLGIYSVFITFLFLNYKKYKLIIPITVVALCIYESIYSFGSRIQSFIILLMALCLYNFIIKPISFKKVLMTFAPIALLFSAMELFRSSEFDMNAVQYAILQQGFKPASELGAVYFTGFHLYEERAHGTMASTEWPMFFNDLISLVTFADFTRWNPQYWYARNYFPDAVVPPETMGPIAESAIWGGEIDLLLRSLINGAFFAFLVRWFLRHKDRWWGVVIYVYCYATCVLTLKYSVFFHLAPLIKTLLPTLLVVEAVRRLIPSKPKATSKKLRKSLTGNKRYARHYAANYRCWNSAGSTG